MKKLTYILTLFCSFLFVLSCNKEEKTENNSPQHVQERHIVKAEQGPSIGVNSRNLSAWESYRSRGQIAGATYHIGRKAQPEEIEAWNIHVFPDGRGLPDGSGTAAEGAILYKQQCAVCHGPNGEGPKPYNSPLIAKASEGKTIGSYWPYATTLFDYIRRAMPYNIPGSLDNDEIYALVAFLLHENEVIEQDAVMDAQSLPKVVMPNKEAFVPDDRETENGLH